MTSTDRGNLLQTHKLELIGRLAAGVAHDFNNLMTAVLGNVGLALTDLPADHPCREWLSHAETAGKRAAELARQLLSFSRRTPQHPQAIDLNAIIKETVSLLRPALDPRISVQPQLDAGLWRVNAEPVQLSQVLVNLCVNARDAMPAGGCLTVETSNVTLSPAEAPAHAGGRPGDFVCLRVRDTGQGIPADILPHIFEAFFTSKEPGKGTGLGLSVVADIVQEYQGWIECRSEVGQGTTFEIYLPRLAVLAAAGPTLAGGTPRGGHETILLADDQDVVRKVGQNILERYGYRVLAVSDAAQAVDLYRQRRAEIDLVVLDLSMPKGSGLDVLQELRGLDPGVRVLLSSGYLADAVEGAPQGAADFLAKPYQPADLLRAVRAVLDRSRSARPAGSEGKASG